MSKLKGICVNKNSIEIKIQEMDTDKVWEL